MSKANDVVSTVCTFNNYFRILRLPTVNFGVKYEAQRIIYDQFQRMRSLFNTSSHEHQVARPKS